MLKWSILVIVILMTDRVSAQKLLVDPTRPANLPVVVNEEGEEGAELITSGPGGGSVIPSGKLTAIVVTDSVKYAIINNEVVYEGQPWRNAILSEVKPYSIILTLEEQQKEIKINDTSFITESNYEF